MQFLMSRAQAIHYQTVGLDGTKPVIVFINSLGTDYRIWDDVMARLGDGYAYVLHDKRGHGLSDTGVTPYTMDDHVDDLEVLLDHLAVQGATIWGLSVGGLIAQRLYDRRPDLVGALVLSNTAHKIGTPAAWNERIAKVEHDGLPSMVDGIMERWFTADFRKLDNAAYLGARNMLARQDGKGYAATCAAIAGADFTELAAKIAVPTLCIAGDGDGATPPDLVQSLSALIPGSRMITLERCGHIPCLEQPSAYVTAVDAFLESLPEI